MVRSLYCNNQFSELVELSLNKIMGSSFYDFFVSQTHLQSFKAMLGACGKTGCRGEFLLKGPAGQEVPTLLSGRSLILNDVEFFASGHRPLRAEAHSGCLTGKRGASPPFIKDADRVKSVLTFMVLCRSVAQAMGGARHPNLHRAPRSARRWPSSAEF